MTPDTATRPEPVSEPLPCPRCGEMPFIEQRPDYLDNGPLFWRLYHACDENGGYVRFNSPLNASSDTVTRRWNGLVAADRAIMEAGDV